MITLKDFFYGCFKNVDLQNLLKIYDLPINGTKDELVKRIIENNPPNLKEFLLHRYDKPYLQNIADNWGLKTTGTKEELKERILENITFPKKLQKEFHIAEMDKKNGVVFAQDLTVEFLLNRYFTKDNLKELLKDNQLPISGNVEDLTERILKKIKPTIEDILSYLYVTDLDDLCYSLKIQSQGKKQDKINLILSKLNLNQNKTSIAKKNEIIIPVSKDFNVKKKCKELIKKDNLTELFSCLLASTEENNISLHNDTIILQNQWTTLERNELLNKISHQDFIVNKNQIVNSLMKIVNSLD